MYLFFLSTSYSPLSLFINWPFYSSIIYSFHPNSSFHLFILSFTHPLIYPFFYLFIYLFTLSFSPIHIHIFYLFILSYIDQLTYAFFHFISLNLVIIKFIHPLPDITSILSIRKNVFWFSFKKNSSIMFFLNPASFFTNLSFL